MTIRIEFKIDIDDDFSDERANPEEKYFNQLLKIKAKLEATFKDHNTLESWRILEEVL